MQKQRGAMIDREAENEGIERQKNRKKKRKRERKKNRHNRESDIARKGHWGGGRGNQEERWRQSKEMTLDRVMKECKWNGHRE